MPTNESLHPTVIFGLSSNMRFSLIIAMVTELSKLYKYTHWPQIRYLSRSAFESVLGMKYAIFHDMRYKGLES